MKIGCVLVTYNPDKQLFEKVLSSVSMQVETVFTADNSNEKYLFHKEITGKNVVYFPMTGNRGIAAAQNAGICYFMEQNFDFILFLDQDSIVEEGSVKKLQDDYICMENAGIPIAAVGPAIINRASNKKYAQQVENTLFKNIVEVRELTSSATLASIKSFQRIGLMDETLFIDGVDHEWCWRGKYNGGYRFFVDETITLSHQLGEGDRFFLMQNIAIPAPSRTYYQFRNYFWLLCRKYVPFRWKVLNGVKYFVKMIYYPLFVAPRVAYLANIFSGIKDGIFTRSAYKQQDKKVLS